MAKKIYSPGDSVGTYTVIDYLDNGKIKCRCNKCGLISDVPSENVKKNKMCRYCKLSFNTKPRVDIAGQRFGRLVAQRYIVKDNGHIAWECLCNCGNTAIVSTGHLMSGHTKSCGCYMRDQTSKANSNDLTGMRFGKLVAIERTAGHQVPSGQILSEYLCRCDCGNMLNVLSMNLVSGNTQSCGCIGSSLGESRLTELLLDAKIKFKRQCTFPGLCSESNGGLLKFDFAILDEDDNVVCLIEYNGEQHYYSEERTTDFGRLQREETDAIKEQYCRDNNIRLYTIRFDEDVDAEFDKIMKSLRA